MKKYLVNLIMEKGKKMDDTIELDGHVGLTYQMLVDFIEENGDQHLIIRETLVKIDFKNGDVFNYLKFLAGGMVKALGY